jgi:hypothetical protein
MILLVSIQGLGVWAQVASMSRLTANPLLANSFGIALGLSPTIFWSIILTRSPLANRAVQLMFRTIGGVATFSVLCAILFFSGIQIRYLLLENYQISEAAVIVLGVQIPGAFLVSLFNAPFLARLFSEEHIVVWLKEAEVQRILIMRIETMALLQKAAQTTDRIVATLPDRTELPQLGLQAENVTRMGMRICDEMHSLMDSGSTFYTDARKSYERLPGAPKPQEVVLAEKDPENEWDTVFESLIKK